MAVSNWVCAWRSVIGSAHVSEHLPCQDHCLVAQVPDTDIVVAAVADGAGSCAHSQIGSKFLVENAIEHMTALIREKTVDPSFSIASFDWRETSFSLFTTLKAALRQLAKEKRIEFKSLSSTLILTISDGNFVALAHVGDGRAAYRNESGEWMAMLTPTKGEEANQTLFLTSDLWDTSSSSPYFGSFVYEGTITAFSILSDGCERSSFEILKYDEAEEKYYDPNLPFKPFFEPNYHQLIKMNHASFDQEQINALWEKFLQLGNKQLMLETDDKSMALAVYTNRKT